MQLDVPAFSAIVVLAAAAAGYFLVCVWLFRLAVPGLAWWGAAYLAASAALIMLGARAVLPGAVSIAIANAVLIAAYGLAWSAARVFDGRRPLLPLVVLGPAIWLVACQVEAFYGSLGARVMLGSALCGAYAFAAAAEIWRGRREARAARACASAVLVLHGLFQQARIALVPFGAPAGGPDRNPFWSGLFVTEGLVFMLALAAALIAMARARAGREARARDDAGRVTVGRKHIEENSP